MSNLKPTTMNSNGFFVFVNPTNNSHFKVAVTDVINFLQPYINLVYDGDQTSKAGFVSNDEFLVNINGAGTNQITMTALNYTMYMISGSTYHSIVETNSSTTDILANTVSSNTLSRGILANSLSIVRHINHTSAFSMNVSAGNVVTNALLAADTATRALLLQSKTSLELDVTDLGNNDACILSFNTAQFYLQSKIGGTTTVAVVGGSNKLDIYAPAINLHIESNGTFSIEGTDVPWLINSDPGTADQVLASQGAGAAPVWKNIHVSGKGTLLNGEVTISNPFIVAGSFIQITHGDLNGTTVPGITRVTLVVNGSFDVKSYVAGTTTVATGDQSLFYYTILQ